MNTAPKLTDEDRIRLATREGHLMHGPLERSRCAKHPKRWETYRWSWLAPDESKGETQRMCLEASGSPGYVRPCAACEAEDE